MWEQSLKGSEALQFLVALTETANPSGGKTTLCLGQPKQNPPGWSSAGLGWLLIHHLLSHFMRFGHNCTSLGRRWSCGTFLRSNPWGRVCGTTARRCWREPLEGSCSTLVINEISSYWENKHQRKEPTTISDLSLRKDVSVIVGSTENNSLVTGSAGTGGGNHTCRALLQIHRACQGGSHLPKTAGNTAGGGHGWCRGCGWLWMGFVETRSVVLALPLSKTRHWALQWCLGAVPSTPQWFLPFWAALAVSCTFRYRSRQCQVSITLSTLLWLLSTQLPLLSTLCPTQDLTNGRTTDVLLPVPSLTLAPDALRAEVPPVLPIKANFSENKYITQSIVDEHPNIFALTFSTFYKKGSERTTSKFFNAIRFSQI